MRSHKPIPGLIDQHELFCQYEGCTINDGLFYTDNPNAKFCCDEHKGKHNRELNKPVVNQFKKWNKGFLQNAIALEKLWDKNITTVNKRELLIAGFNSAIMDKQKVTQDGRICFQYFEFLLIQSIDKMSFEIAKDTTTKNPKR